MSIKIAIVVPTNDKFEAIFGYADILRNGLIKYESQVTIFFYSNTKRLYNQNSKHLKLISDFNINDFEVVILNYVGYGYSRIGVPFHLVLLMLSSRFRSLKTITIFHELHASFKSSFLLGRGLTFLQKINWLLVAGFSDSIVATNSVMYKMMCSFNKKAYLLPLYSNIPVKKRMPNVSNKTAAVFGTIGRRKEVYSKLLNYQSVVKNLIDEVIDIGDCDVELKTIVGRLQIKVSFLGLLPSDYVADVLKSVNVAFIDYPSHLLEKSGVFAAYASYGLCVVNTNVELHNSDDNDKVTLIEGVHYFSIGNFSSTNVQYNQKLIDWYSYRTPDIVVERIKQLLLN